MEPKRDVNKNLGRTQHRNADTLYAEIRKRKKGSRACPFYGGKKYPHLSKDSHDLHNPNYPNPDVPIEEFDFLEKNGTWDLQSYCKVCYKVYRRARIDAARARWAPMTDDGIRQYYRDNVKGSVMRCSVCKNDLDPLRFPISRSMEKGLHNECLDCVSSKAASVREQAWLSEGDWASWRQEVIDMRKEPLITCAGWPPAVEAGMCLLEGSGKKMAADHKVPLRAGGINDAKNFQPLCKSCNSVKTDQLDPRLSLGAIRSLVGESFRASVSAADSIQTIERKLKTALLERISQLEGSGAYFEAIKTKKKVVNGQWDVERTYVKGKEWLTRGGTKIDEIPVTKK